MKTDHQIFFSNLVLEMHGDLMRHIGPQSMTINPDLFVDISERDRSISHWVVQQEISLTKKFNYFDGVYFPLTLSSVCPEYIGLKMGTWHATQQNFMIIRRHSKQHRIINIDFMLLSPSERTKFHMIRVKIICIGSEAP